MAQRWLVVLVLLPILGLLFSLQSVRSATPTTLTTQQREDIEDFVQNVADCYSIPGMTFTVVGADDSNQWWSYSHSFGKADLIKDVDVTTKTLFAIGSLTKAFTSTLLAILIEESNGEVTWETPIRKILGDSFLLADEQRTNDVTLVDLLSHRVGVARHEFLWLLSFVTKDQLMERLHLMEMDVDFRTAFGRNNNMYALAGAVAEKIGGKSWEELTKEKIFDPLGMDSSSFINIEGPDYAGLARVHYFMNNGSLEQTDMTKYESLGVVGPAGSIVSNAEDMAKWLAFQLSNGKNSSNHQVISSSGLRFTHQAHMAMPISRTLRDLAYIPRYPVAQSYETYGLGWSQGHYRGVSVVRHSGSFIGYENLITMQRNPGFAIYTSMNGPITQLCMLASDVIHMYINDVIMQTEPWLDRQTACTYPEPWESLVPKLYPGPAFSIDKTVQPTRDLEDYVGAYGNYLYGQLEVWVNASEGRLEASAGTPLTHFAMYPTAKETEFAMKYLGKAEFFDMADIASIFSAPRPAIVTFMTRDTSDDFYQLRLMFTEYVTFEKGLDVSNPPKPDFLTEKKCENSAQTALLSSSLLAVLFAILAYELTGILNISR